METYQAVILALLQGLTEFLPISSSAHLILVPVITDWPDQGLAFDVAVHVGTLLAVSAYFRRDLACMLRDWSFSLGGRPATAESRLAWLVILATIPVGLVGISLPESVEDALRSPLLIAAATILFALVLWRAQTSARENRGLRQMRWYHGLVIGLFQVLALVPGTSRSGITITAGLFLGFERESAARFSFLMSVPVIALAGMVKTVELIRSPDSVAWSLLFVGVGVSALVAYLTIDWFLRLLERIGLMPFVVYRLVLGELLIFAFLPTSP